MLAVAALIGSVARIPVPQVTGIVEKVSNTVLTSSGISQSSAQAKFGTTSITGNGTNTLQFNYPSGIQTSSQDVTVEFWAYTSSSSSGPWAVQLANQLNGAGQAISWGLGNGGTGYFAGSDTTGTYASQSNPSNTTNTWTHYAFWTNTVNYTVWVNGTVQLNNYSWPYVAPDDYRQTVSKFYVELLGWKQYSNYTSGIYLDDIRVSTGNRYSGANYTVPSTRTAVDGTTLILIQSV